MILRSFDAFPKLHESYESRSNPKHPLNYVLLVVALFFLYMETTSWMTPTPNYRFEVDRGINDHFQINLDVIVRDKCQDISVYIRDVSDDSLLVNELVKIIPIFPDPESDTEWCQVAGIFETNKVKGRLTIAGTQRYGSRSFDITHSINELSFGDFYPEVNNPLDGTHKEVSEASTVEYFLSIVPARYMAFGLSVDTYLYSAKNRVRSVANTYQYPQITFDYDFDPIKVEISDNRMSFFQWMLRVVNIGGGLVFSARAALRLMKRKMRQREDSHGLLVEHVVPPGIVKS